MSWSSLLNTMANQLHEEQKMETIPLKIQKILKQVMLHDEYIHALLTVATDWNWTSDPNGTASIYLKNGKIQLQISKALVNSQTPRQLTFVIAHELEHFFRRHLVNSTVKPDANTANIAEDVFINEEIMKNKNFCGIAVKALSIPTKTQDDNGNEVNDTTAGWFLKERMLDGTKTIGVDAQFGEPYTGNPNSTALYQWMMKKKKEAGQDDKPEDGQDGDGDGDSPPVQPKVGDVIQNHKTGQYGKVTEVKGGKVTKIQPIASEKEAEDIVMGKKSLLKKPALPVGIA